MTVSPKYIAWEEIIPDKRWAQRNYSVIKILNRENNRIKVLQQKTRLFSPQLSLENDSLICISKNLQNEISLIIFDLSTEIAVDTIPINNINNAFSPVWINKNEIAYIALDGNGKKLMKYNLINNNSSILSDAGFINIDNLSADKRRLFFIYDYEMVRNIYMLDLETLEILRVTNSKHGSDFPYYNDTDNNLYYSDYTINGYRPTKINLDSVKLISLDKVTKYNPSWADMLSTNITCNLQKTDIPITMYNPQSYNRILHSFTFHSWMPFYVNPDDLFDLTTSIYPGISLFSQNKLSTLTSQISYFYRDHKSYIESRFIFQGIYRFVNIGW